MKKSAAGFTLIELMIVVVLVGIIMMFAIPNYQEYTKRTKRSVAQGDLVALAAQVEKYFSQRFTYAGVTAALVYNTVSPADGSADPAYNLAVVLTPDAAAPTGFYVTAVPTGGQAGDGALAYDSEDGIRCWYEASDTVPGDLASGCTSW